MHDEHSHAHSNKKSCGIGTTAFLVMLASTLIFYNSTINDDDPTQNFNFSTDTPFKILIMLLSSLVGINEFFEMIDHISHNHLSTTTESYTQLNEDPTNPKDHSREMMETARQLTAFNKCKCQTVRKVGITIATSPLLLAAFYGIFTQNLSLMEAFDINNRTWKNLAAAAMTIILGARLVAIPWMHTIEHISGNYEKYSKKVMWLDENEELASFRSPWSRAAVFLVFCGTHLAESFLLSNEINQGWIYVVSIISLTGSRAVAHLDHATALRNAYAKWEKRTRCSKILTTITGSVSGIAHAAPGILSTIYFWNKTNWPVRVALLLSDGIEALTGLLEHQVHGGRYVDNYLSR